MKIVDVKTLLVGRMPWLFVKLITDEGIEGLGERPGCNAKNVDAQVHLIESLSRQFVIGANPFDIEKLWQLIYASRHDFRHPGLDTTPALGAIEMACWDIVGKAVNKPVYNLLGGKYHDKLWAYAYMPTDGIWESPEKAGEIALQLVKAGKSACKIDPFPPIFPIPRDIPLKDIRRAAEIFKYMRAAVGDELEIGIGTHGQLTTYSAIRWQRC